MSNKPTHEKEVEQLAEQVLETYGATKREEYNWIIAAMVEMYKAGQQSKFTIQDFEKGLMLAGLVEPANEQEAKEKEALGKYVEAKKIIHKEYDRICPETNKQCQTGWCLPDGACSIQEVAKHGPIETIKTNNMQFKGFTQEHPSTPQGVEVLAEQIEEKGLTVTFGLQPEHLKVIEEKTSVWEGAVYSYQIWKDIGKVIAWEPLTAALYYFRYLRDQAVPPSSNQQNLIHPSVEEENIEFAKWLDNQLPRYRHYSSGWNQRGSKECITDEQLYKIYLKDTGKASQPIQHPSLEQKEEEPTKHQIVYQLINLFESSWISTEGNDPVFKPEMFGEGVYEMMVTEGILKEELGLEETIQSTQREEEENYVTGSNNSSEVPCHARFEDNNSNQQK